MNFPGPRMLFTKGNDALQRENYDFNAIVSFHQVLQKSPCCMTAASGCAARSSAKLERGGFFKKMLSNAKFVANDRQGADGVGKDPLEALAHRGNRF